MDHCNHDRINSCIDIVPIFSTLSTLEREEISMLANSREYRKGEFIYHTGSKEGNLFIIHSGKIKISRISEEGKEQVIRILEAGEFLGELALFGSVPLNENAEAIEDAKICVMNGSSFRKYIEKYPKIAIKIMEELSRRLDFAETMIENINLHSVEWRLAQALLRLKDRYNVVELKITKGNLASQIGMSQETLSRKLALFQEQGLIKIIGNKKIAIINSKMLNNIE